MHSHSSDYSSLFTSGLLSASLESSFHLPSAAPTSNSRQRRSLPDALLRDSATNPILPKPRRSVPGVNFHQNIDSRGLRTSATDGARRLEVLPADLSQTRLISATSLRSQARDYLVWAGKIDLTMNDDSPCSTCTRRRNSRASLTNLPSPKPAPQIALPEAPAYAELSAKYDFPSSPAPSSNFQRRNTLNSLSELDGTLSMDEDDTDIESSTLGPILTRHTLRCRSGEVKPSKCDVESGFPLGNSKDDETSSWSWIDFIKVSDIPSAPMVYLPAKLLS